MPGLDYLNEPYDTRSDNYFNSIPQQAAFDFIGPWAVNKAARTYAKSVKPGKAAYKELKGLRALLSKNPLTGEPIERANLLTKQFIEARAKRATALELGATATRYGKMFGIAGAVIGGWELGKSLLKISKAFEMDPDEIAKNRRTQLYGSGEEYFDTRAAYTQRQRAIQVIHNSQLSGGRRAFGEESSWLHM